MTSNAKPTNPVQPIVLSQGGNSGASGLVWPDALNPGPMRKLIKPEECRHLTISPTLIFKAIDVLDHAGFVCQDCMTEFVIKPKPSEPEIGAAELARKAYSIDYPDGDWDANQELWTAFATTFLQALAALKSESGDQSKEGRK